MVSCSIVLRTTNALKDGSFPVTLRITYQRKRKYYSLGFNCHLQQWNPQGECFTKAFPDYKVCNAILTSKKKQAYDIIRDFERETTTFSFEEFDTLFRKTRERLTLTDYFDIWILRMEKAGQIGNSVIYRTTKNSMTEFAEGQYRKKNVKLTEINLKFLKDYEYWLRTEKGCRDTSISNYMRTLRALLNKAIKDQVYKQEDYPFTSYKITELNHKTQKRAISKETIDKIKNIELAEKSNEWLARNIFLFSYYTRGMNFIDICYLKRSNIYNNRIDYVRRKTGQPFTIAILPPVQQIIDHYQINSKSKEGYIFPIFDETIHRTDKQKNTRLKTALKKTNRNLKKLAQLIGEENLHLTSYVARHTYATVLKKAGVSTSLISEGMGHQTEKVTQTYLKAFELDEIDKADQFIL